VNIPTTLHAIWLQRTSARRIEEDIRLREEMDWEQNTEFVTSEEILQRKKDPPSP
jgi:hypothetical protein